MRTRRAFSRRTSSCTAASRASARRSTLVYLRGGGSPAGEAGRRASSAKRRGPQMKTERLPRPAITQAAGMAEVFTGDLLLPPSLNTSCWWTRRCRGRTGWRRSPPCECTAAELEAAGVACLLRKLFGVADEADALRRL